MSSWDERELNNGQGMEAHQIRVQAAKLHNIVTDGGSQIGIFRKSSLESYFSAITIFFKDLLNAPIRRSAILSDIGEQASTFFHSIPCSTKNGFNHVAVKQAALSITILFADPKGYKM